MNKREIIDRFSQDDDKKMAARVLDWINQVQRNYEVVFTHFLDPHQEQITRDIVRPFMDLGQLSFGGYEAAERRLIAVFPDYIQVSGKDFPLRLLSISGNTTYHEVTHRDYLGAILGLGIKREMVGDLLVSEDGCQAIVKDEVADTLVIHLDQVGRMKVQVEEKPIHEIVLPETTTKDIETTVPSLRLDAVASSGFNLSRTKMVPLIKGEKVRVNWEIAADPAAAVKEGDVISVKSKGRMVIVQVGGRTRKDRLFVHLKRFV